MLDWNFGPVHWTCARKRIMSPPCVGLITLNQLDMFKWYMTRLVVNNTKRHVSKWGWSMYFNKIRHHSRLNSELLLRGLMTVIIWKSQSIFTLDSYNFCISNFFANTWHDILLHDSLPLIGWNNLWFNPTVNIDTGIESVRFQIDIQETNYETKNTCRWCQT